MSALFKIVRFGFVFDDGNLRRAGNFGNFCRNFGARDKRHADGGVRAVVHQKDVIKNNLVSNVKSGVAVLAERAFYLLNL